MTVNEMNKMFLTSPEYEFLRSDAHLGQNIGMLCLGGSLAYGTNLPGKGDVDLRGFYFENKSEIIGMTPNSGQVVETNTDTTLYAFNRFVELILSNNPNTIEQLGCKPEHYFYKSDVAEEMIKNAKIFLSQRCIRSFGGYANQQLNRLENAIARDSLTQAKKEEHILRSLENAMADFERRYTNFDYGSIVLFTDKSAKENYDTEIFCNIDLKHYPVRDLNGIINEFTNITRQYGKINHRNKKKDEEHLDKHAMHLIRLYYMALDILEKGEINTYREKEREFLLQVRQGLFRKSDGTYNDAFFDFRKELNDRFEYASKHTDLPPEADMKKVNELVMWANEKIVRGDVNCQWVNKAL
jgi:predicted nucleotidyltransferase